MLAYGGRPRVHPLPMEDHPFKHPRALIEPDYEEMDKSKAKRAKKAHDAEAAVKQEDCHFKSLKAAKYLNREHALNVRELLGFVEFVDEHQEKQIMDHPLMREAPMLYTAFKVINQLFGNMDESGLTIHHQIAKILGLMINLKNRANIESWQKFIMDWKWLIAVNNGLK